MKMVVYALGAVNSVSNAIPTDVPFANQAISTFTTSKTLILKSWKAAFIASQTRIQNFVTKEGLFLVLKDTARLIVRFLRFLRGIRFILLIE